MELTGTRVSQLLIHLLFWALFVFVSLFVFSDYYWAENPFLQYFIILLAIVYLNTSLLLPYFIRRKQYVLYTFLIALIAFAGTQLYCNYFAQCGCTITKCLSNYLWQTLVPIIFFSFLWMLFRNQENERQLAEISQERTAMELQYLKSQINPHVLFNNLNTIYSYALEKPDQVPEMVLMLSDNLKHVLYDSNAPKVALEKELTYIDNYIAFQKIRTENMKEVTYTKNIERGSHTIAPLLLITLIENAFKHSPPKSPVTIAINLKNGILELVCRNLRRALTEIDQPSIGLKNLRKRLGLLYEGKHQLELSDDTEFVARLTIDLS